MKALPRCAVMGVYRELIKDRECSAREYKNTALFATWHRQRGPELNLWSMRNVGTLHTREEPQ
jgi:hypothetical protein